MVTLVKNGSILASSGTPDQAEKPDLIQGAGAAVYTPQPGDVLITPAEAARRGWVTGRPRGFTLADREGAEKLLPFLRRLGSIYNRGAKSSIKTMDLVDLELPKGGTLRLQLTDVTPESMRALGEMFEVLDGVVKKGERTDVFLEITDPEDDCLFIREFNNQKGEA